MKNEWLERSRKVLAQGETGTNSKRPSHYIEGIYPTHIVAGRRCKLIAADGKEYIDFVSGLGTNLLGYDHPKVTEAIQYQACNGSSFSLPHVLEVEVAELIQKMIPCAQKVRFLKSGNEATLAVVRIARCYTDQPYVVSDGYHGWGDLWTSLTSPAKGVLDPEELQIFEWPKDGFNVDPIGIHEPIRLNLKNRKEELLEIRSQTRCLILDEIVTGFRVPKNCVSEWWNIKPDLICLGKGIANGMPLSVVAGSYEAMDCADDYFISSTFSGEAISLAAAKATLKELSKRDPQELMEEGIRFCGDFNEICKPLGTRIVGYGSRGETDFYENDNTVLLFQELVKAGIFMGRAFFYNWAHMEENINEYVLNVVTDCVNKVKSGKVKLEGVAPKPTFRRNG